MTIPTYAVPTASPDKITVDRTSATEMSVAWEGITLAEARGFFDYILMYEGLDEDTGGPKKRDVQMKVVPGSESGAMVDELTPGVGYSVSVAARTSAGVGVSSDPIEAEGRMIAKY